MIAWLADENFHGHIVRALLLRQPDIDLLRVQDVGLLGADDGTILSWCAENERILLTHDAATVPEQAYERVVAGQPMPGIIVISKTLAHTDVVEDILLAEICSESEEWIGKVTYLPL
jgi:predicted nuclease of predicted toxin-antitoxin system